MQNLQKIGKNCYKLKKKTIKINFNANSRIFFKREKCIYIYEASYQLKNISQVEKHN